MPRSERSFDKLSRDDVPFDVGRGGLMVMPEYFATAYLILIG